MGFGNHALIWFWAWRGTVHGQERRVLRTPAMLPWLDLFPAARDLTLDRGSVRLTDARPRPWTIAGDRDAPEFQQDWTREELTRFVDEVLLSSSDFQRLLGETSVDDDTLVLNVRRGDYYDPEHIDQWGFDIEGYLDHVIPTAVARRPTKRVHLVSDDLDWCREHLSWLEDQVDEVTLADPSHSAQHHFATIAGASRLVVTNSTFSYWGGYVGDVLHHDDAARDVWAPRFFNRDQNDGRSWLLLDGWTVTEDLPGGWAP